MKRGEIDPLDPHDPRVLVEWTDMIGQTVKPGDWVTWDGWKSLGVGQIVCIQRLRKDGRPFTVDEPQVEVVPNYRKDGKWFSNGYPYTIKNACLRIIKIPTPAWAVTNDGSNSQSLSP